MKLWWVNAFVGAEADGNATCVVDDARADEDWDRWDLARALRAPDTVFIGDLGPSTHRVRFFSPHEGEMSFCGQGLIAADAVLRCRRQTGQLSQHASAMNPEPLTLVTATGDVRTRTDLAEDAVSWFEVPATRVSVAPAVSLESLKPSFAEPATVVDSGRTRAFLRLPSEAELRALALAPESVVAFCGEHRLSGVCFYVELGARRVALRVFTVSLAGREDATTGGAVLGLARLLPSGRWEISQGQGHRLSRGRLLLDSSSSNEVIRVGGAVNIVASGNTVGAARSRQGEQ